MGLLSKPMSIAELLDRSFQLYRKHFLAVFLLTLILMGPVYFIQQLLLFSFNDLPFLPQSDLTIEDSLSYWAGSSAEYNPGFIVFTLLFIPLYMVFLFPIAAASHLHLVQSAVDGKPLHLGGLLRKAFSPYWRLVGNSTLFGLMMIGIYFALIIAVVVVMLLFGTITSLIGVGLMEISSDPFSSGVTIVVLIALLYVAAVLAVVSLYSFFIIRFGFFLPIVALDSGAQDGTISRSWRMTKGSFWRLFVVLAVLLAIVTVLMLSIQALVITVFKMSLLGQIIQILIGLAISPILTITFALIYLDLRVRSEGSDLEQVLQARLANITGSNHASSAEGNVPGHNGTAYNPYGYES
ncbi:hypothetical protein EBB07_34185 [Paenibacillaceae bacterium]|nr:hypothetical protein EBB07_34185 [Paenibacillaceae bacterium]